MRSELPVSGSNGDLYRNKGVQLSSTAHTNKDASTGEARSVTGGECVGEYSCSVFRETNMQGYFTLWRKVSHLKIIHLFNPSHTQHLLFLMIGNPTPNCAFTLGTIWIICNFIRAAVGDERRLIASVLESVATYFLNRLIHTLLCGICGNTWMSCLNPNIRNNIK